MADVTLQIHYITSGLGGGGNYLTGQYIRVIADGSAIRAELWDAPEGGSYIDQPSGGPNLSGDGITVSSGAFNYYSYCNSADLVSYVPSEVWPYAEYGLSVDHPSCTLVVCDLSIDSYSVTNESTAGMGDGEIALVSSSTNGTIKYGFDPDFDYATGLTSPLTGLTTGNYIVYAKDAGGCTDLVAVFVGIDFFYGPRWRAEYDCLFPNGSHSRIDIEERDYVGSVIEVCCGEKPFELEYNPIDNSQVVPSMAFIQLFIDRGEEDKYIDIRTGYDRQFLCKKYKDVGSGFVLEWTGYFTPEFYSEPYLHPPFAVTLKAIDGLGELQNKPFVALSGEEYFGNMSIMNIVSECLKKLPFQLNVRSCVNIYEANMASTVADDPLFQTYIKSENYRGAMCTEVLTDILKPFVRAELFQALGVYWIRTNEQSVDTTLLYREFDEDGVYVSNSSIQSRKSLDFPSNSQRLEFAETSQQLSFSRNYGKFIILHDLDKDNNMVDSGGFELKDIDPSTEFFRGWQIFPTQTNVKSGLEYTQSDNSKSAFFFQWANNSNDQSNNILQTELLPIHVEMFSYEQRSTNFNLSFKVHLAPSVEVPWIWLGWKLRYVDTDSGDFYDWGVPNPEYTPLAPTPTANEAKINNLYITQFNSPQTFDFKGFRMPPAVDQENFTLQVSFYFHNHKGRDFDTDDDVVDFDGLRAVVTETGTNPHEDRRYFVAHGSDTIGYQLQNTTSAESVPDIIEPDDYNSTSNPYKWVKIAQSNLDRNVPFLGRLLIDDFRISLFDIAPASGFSLVDPPETVTYEQVTSTINESILTEEVKCGDSPAIVGYEYIYNGFFMLSDGTRTSVWGRKGVTESRFLLDIYLGHLAAQGGQSLRVLSGVGLADIQLAYINSLEDQIDSVKYRFTRFKFNDKRGSYEIEMEETKVGADGESPPDDVSITFDSTLHTFDEYGTVTFDEG